jgi:hypothetical protein
LRKSNDDFGVSGESARNSDFGAVLIDDFGLGEFLEAFSLRIHTFN